MESKVHLNSSKPSIKARLTDSGRLFDHATLPRSSEIGLASESILNQLLNRSLFEPVSEFIQRPSKSFRSSLVSAGFRISRQYLCDFGTVDMAMSESNEVLCQSIVELLHAGSLIVDDIQDESYVRRGAACLHRLHGEALALNAGNWLYFWPLRLAERLEVSDALMLRFMKAYHETLTQAHYGQALDIHVRIEDLQRHEMAEVSQFIAERKTGALTAFSLQMGLWLHEVPHAIADLLGRYGLQFGALLQKFDDIGNTMSHREPDKQFEDLLDSRPSWVWAVVVEHYSEDDFARFRQAVAALPDPTAIERWFTMHDFYEVAQHAVEQELHDLDKSMQELTDRWGLIAQKELSKLSERLKYAYTKSA